LLSKYVRNKIHKNIVLPVVLYGCETWSFTLREEHRLRVFADRVLRKTCGSKRDEVQESGEDYITRNFMILTKYYSGDQIKISEMGGSCSTYGRQERCTQLFGGET
jgi:hypothetical protein